MLLWNSSRPDSPWAHCNLHFLLCFPYVTNVFHVSFSVFHCSLGLFMHSSLWKTDLTSFDSNRFLSLLLSDLIANQSSLRLSHHYHLTWVVQQRVWKVSWVVHQCVWKVSERSLRDLWEVCSSITKGEFGIRLEILGDLLRDSPLKPVNQSNPHACDLCKVVIQ